MLRGLGVQKLFFLDQKAAVVSATRNSPSGYARLSSTAPWPLLQEKTIVADTTQANRSFCRSASSHSNAFKVKMIQSLIQQQDVRFLH